MLPAAEPDWPAVKSKALETLVDLVKLDTAQPEGNEILAARYLKEKPDREGLASEIFEAAPGRASLVAGVTKDSTDSVPAGELLTSVAQQAGRTPATSG